MKKILLLLVLSMGFILVACSNDSAEDSGSYDAEDHSVEQETESYSNANSVGDSDGDMEQSEAEYEEEDSSSTDDSDSNQIDRKIIYTADLTIEVKDYQQSLNSIQTQVADYGGYIVESNMYNHGDDIASGYLTARVPQDKFREFIKIVEEGSNKVLENSISGQDVTEEYVDLESRLKSKRVVEERLLSFMEQAEKTEDLLTISDDLAAVQGEIDEILGRMQYLENRTDLATVTIHIEERNVNLSSMDDDDLNTWERTKEQFLKSINILLSFLSGLIVFIVGNLPVLLIMGIIGWVVFYMIRKRNRKKHE